MKVNKINDMYHSQYSQLIFNKNWNELNWNEKQKVLDYEYDLSHPKWKKIIIDNKETNYSVSHLGKVRHDTSGKILKGSYDKRGYVKVSIYIDNIHLKTRLVHQLVAIAFTPNPDNKPQVNHINGNKEFNWVGNLEWNTCQENIDHAIRTGLRNLNGVNAVSNIYTEEQVHQVCKMLEKGKGPKEIAETLGVPRNLVNRIKYLGKWKGISSQYNIPEVHKLPYGSSKVVFKLLSDNITDPQEIIKRANLPDTINSRKFITAVKNKYRKLQCSSTSSKERTLVSQ